MMTSKFVAPFLLGCVAALVVGREVVGVASQGNAQGPDVQVCADKDDVMHLATGACPAGQRRLILGTAASAGGSGAARNTTSDNAPNPSLDQATLKELNLRLIKLEAMGCAPFQKTKVVAPFEVVDSAGKRIFAVISGAAGLFSAGGAAPVAGLGANQYGGLFFANGRNIKTNLGVVNPTVVGLQISEADKPTVLLGKDFKQRNYKLAFLSRSSQIVAGVGEDLAGRGGVVIISDARGQEKVMMEVLDDGNARVAILGDARRPIAALTSNQRGGVFYACRAEGQCDPVAVSAGTNDAGVGVIATGPRFFIGGPTGVPGSFLIGKR